MRVAATIESAVSGSDRDRKGGNMPSMSLYSSVHYLPRAVADRHATSMVEVSVHPIPVQNDTTWEEETSI